MLVAFLKIQILSFLVRCCILIHSKIPAPLLLIQKPNMMENAQIEERKPRRKLKTSQSCQESAMAVKEGVWHQSNRNLFQEDIPKESQRAWSSSSSPISQMGTLRPRPSEVSTLWSPPISDKAESLNSVQRGSYHPVLSGSI